MKPQMKSRTAGKKSRRSVRDAVVHITATFNNTIVTFADRQGNVLTWATTGSSGFKGARKGTPYAAQITVDGAGKKAQDMGVQNVDVRVQGVGSGRDSAVRALHAAGFKISSLVDVTPMPHNGCRSPKRRRV
ncbi:MAG: 30S ribosomal protein S11 [Gammaproteobacteria bacterium]